MMEYQYYIGEGPPAERIVAEMNESRKLWAEKHESFGERHAFEHWWRSDKRGVRGPGYKERLSEQQARDLGLRYAGKLGDLHAYAPHMGTKKGKALAAEIAEINVHWINVSEYLIKQTGMQRMAADWSTRTLACSAAGHVHGRIVVQVPVGGDEGGMPMPTPPAWMREATKAEVDALYAEAKQ